MIDATSSGTSRWASRVIVTLLALALFTTASIGSAAAIEVTDGTVFEASDDGPTVEIGENLTLDSPFEYPDNHTVDLSPHATFESDGDTNVTVESIGGTWTNLTVQDVSAGLTIDPADKQRVTVEGESVAAVDIRSIDDTDRETTELVYRADTAFSFTATGLSANETIQVLGSDGTVLTSGTTDGTGTASFTLGPGTEGVTFAVEPEPRATDSDSGGAPSSSPEVISSGSTTGVDASTSVEPTRTERATLVVDVETGGASVTFTEAAATERITFDDPNVDGTVAVSEYDSEPDAIGDAPGASVVVTRITVPEPEQSATIRTRVSRDRLAEIGAAPEDLRIDRFDEAAGEWQPLDTEIIERTDERVVLEARTSGFSFFSVNAVGEPEAKIATPGEVTAGEEFALDGSPSSDRHGKVVSYEWRVAGESLTGETVTTAIDTAKETTVNLTVTNDAGETDTTTTTVTVTDASTENDTGSTDPTTGVENNDAPEEQDGFGATLAVVAILAAVLFARRAL